MTKSQHTPEQKALQYLLELANAKEADALYSAAFTPEHVADVCRQALEEAAAPELLEPVEGDVIHEAEKHTGAKIACADAYYWKNTFIWEDRQPAQIIQRNGKPFMWPQREESNE